MTTNIQREINHIVELKSRANRLDNLIQGYRLCARTEGKSVFLGAPAYVIFYLVKMLYNKHQLSLRR